MKKEEWKRMRRILQVLRVLLLFLGAAILYWFPPREGAVAVLPSLLGRTQESTPSPGEPNAELSEHLRVAIPKSMNAAAPENIRVSYSYWLNTWNVPDEWEDMYYKKYPRTIHIQVNSAHFTIEPAESSFEGMEGGVEEASFTLRPERVSSVIESLISKADYPVIVKVGGISRQLTEQKDAASITGEYNKHYLHRALIADTSHIYDPFQIEESVDEIEGVITVWFHPFKDLTYEDMSLVGGILVVTMLIYPAFLAWLQKLVKGYGKNVTRSS